MTDPSIKLLSTLGVLAPLKETVLPAYEDVIGVAIEAYFSPTNVLIEQVAAGQRGHVLIAISETVRTYAREGIVVTDSVRDVASTRVGLAKPAGSAAVDISTRDAFVETLFSARSIAVSQTGASGVFFRALIERLGIAHQILPKSRTIQQGLTAELLLTGEAELAVQQLSELKAVKGVDVIGSLPEELNHVTTFTAAIFNDCRSVRGVGGLLDFITGSLAHQAYVAGGLSLPPDTRGALR